jgi:hypothetical protein
MFSCTPRDTGSFYKPIKSRLHKQTAAYGGEHYALFNVGYFLAAINRLPNNAYFISFLFID